MHTWVLLACLALPAAPAVPVDGLVAEFQFEEGGARRPVDASGLGQQARSAGVERVRGHGGWGLRFAEAGSVVRVASRPSLSLDRAITLEAWVLPGPISDESRVIIAKNDEYLLRIDKASEGGRVSFFVHVGSPGVTWEPRVSSVGPISPGVWHHIAGTWDGRKLRLYVDGDAQGEVDRSGSPNPNPYPVMIGNFEYPSCHGGAFGGAIDEVRIYQRALRPEEVRQGAREGQPQPAE
ncbi:MAG TPA: LamG domain-containing protein [Armatimonadota bacterium]|nr:LamG domain-containing protein [Armatimonadota bacterium]HQK92028.1 LamG domain-containing protein [Armatimonadota bacterium]